jgi:hypothetical protein
VAIIGAARLGQGDAPCGAIEQPDAQPRLELGKMAREPGFRDAELLGRGREALMFDDFGKEIELVQVAHADCPIDGTMSSDPAR